MKSLNILCILFFSFLINHHYSQCYDTITTTGGGSSSCNIPGGACTASSTQTLSSTILSGESTTITFRLSGNTGVFYSCFYNIPIHFRVYAMPGNQLIYSVSCTAPGSTPFFGYAPCASDTGIKTVTFTPTANVTSIRFEGTSTFTSGCGTQPFTLASTGVSGNSSVVVTQTAGPSAPTGSGGNTNICSGSTFTFPARTCATGTLRWYENNTPSGVFYTGATVNPTSTTTYYPYCYSSCNSAAGNSATALICEVAGSGSVWTWSGCSSTNWFDPCNWDRGSIPNTTSNVIVPNTTNKPLVSGATANCYDITIQSSLGARIDVNSGAGGVLNITKP